jgi:hypothetical protein
MSQRRIRKRQTGLRTLPYWRSILASLLLVLSMMFLSEVLTDPRSGDIRSPEVVAPAFALFAIVEAAVFYGEFRLRRRRPPAAARTPRKAAMKGAGAHAN